MNPCQKISCFTTWQKAYISHLLGGLDNTYEAGRHDTYVAAIIKQCVQKEAYGSSLQRPFRRKLENILLGDARQRGQTHQWLYDRVNLSILLTSLGFKDP